MESFFGFLGLIAIFGLLLVMFFSFTFRGLKKEREKWYSNCKQAFAAIMQTSGFSDFVARLSVDERRLKIIFCVYASFARVERTATEQDRLNELSIDDFNTLLDLDVFVEKSDAGSEEIKAVASQVNDALIPFRSGKTDDRNLFYKILVKSFMQAIGYHVSPEPKADDLYVVTIVDIITMGRLKNIKRI